MCEKEVFIANHKLKKVLLENELLKSKVFMLENNNTILESRISQLMREKVGNDESLNLLKERIIKLQQEKEELEQAISEIYDGE